MKHTVLLHPDAVKYLDSLTEKERARCYGGLKCLEEDPYTPRPKCDVRKLRGERKTAYRLRVGDHRFTYVVKEDHVYVEEAFRRGRGY
jgi:mRNA-degrading endonuclease RelE of RelBE toxin-antitoxin system